MTAVPMSWSPSLRDFIQPDWGPQLLNSSLGLNCLPTRRRPSTSSDFLGHSTVALCLALNTDRRKPASSPLPSILTLAQLGAAPLPKLEEEQGQFRLGPRHGPREQGWLLTAGSSPSSGLQSCLHNAQTAPLLLLSHLTTALSHVVVAPPAGGYVAGRPLGNLVYAAWSSCC